MSDHTYDMAMSEAMLAEFYLLEKEAGITAGTGRIIGTGIGALGGGLLGYRRGEQTGEGGTVGAIKGSLLGAGAGLLGGQLATRAGQQEALRFGQRQLHGATGYMPGQGLLGRGGPGTKWYQLGQKGGKQLTGEARLKALKDMGFHFSESATPEKALEEARKTVGEGFISGKMPKSVQEFWAKRRAGSEMARRQLAEGGMTSIPGLAKGYVGRGLPTAGGQAMSPLQVAKANVMAPGLAMGLGVPALMSAGSVKEYRETGDKKRLFENLAGNVGFGLGGALPMTAMMGLGAATGAAGRLIGRGVEAAQGTPAALPVGQVPPR